MHFILVVASMREVVDIRNVGEMNTVLLATLVAWSFRSQESHIGLSRIKTCNLLTHACE